MWKNISKKRRIIAILTSQLCVMSLLAGCSAVEDEKDKIVIVEQDPTVIEYNLAMVTVDDVDLIKSVSCTFTQLEGQEVSFGISGKRITKVYVEDGDTVKKGQLLAELSSGTRDDEIENLEYWINKNELALKHLDENEQNEISNRWLQYATEPWRTMGGEEGLKKGIEDYQKSNQKTRESLQESIRLDKKQLEQVKKEMRESRVYAKLDGIVDGLKERLEGTTSVRNEVIMKIMDSSECYFIVKDKSYAPYFKEGEGVDMSIAYGTGAGTHTLVPYEMDKWSDVLVFTMAEDSDIVIEPGTSGTLKILLDQRKQVLCLPANAIHQADDKQYVYVLGENNMREVKWIETGLTTSDKVEIISGLEEGEKVILR